MVGWSPFFIPVMDEYGVYSTDIFEETRVDGFATNNGYAKTDYPTDENYHVLAITKFHQI